MSKTIYDINEENRDKYDTRKNTYDDFPVGMRVKIICACQDFTFFSGEIGTVTENKNRYLGIHVEYDEPRKYKNGQIETGFNFEPNDLIALAELNIKSFKYCPCCGGELKESKC